MNIYSITRAIGIITIVAVTAAGMPSAASTTTQPSGKFSLANSPEETIYRPECWIVQADGTWLPLRSVECDW
jgi:hypothetical protein